MHHAFAKHLAKMLNLWSSAARCLPVRLKYVTVQLDAHCVKGRDKHCNIETGKVWASRNESSIS
eukprot:1160372-Pelagomonas_calceolata.AAC.3